MPDSIRLRSGLMALALIIGLVFGASPASAQSLVDPTAMEFQASADHDVVDDDGTPVLSQYEAQFFLPGAALPFQTAPLGKPTPDAGGLIRIPFASLSARPSPGIVSEARVAAIGPGGSEASDLSPSFMFSPPPAPPPEPPPTVCTYALSPATQTVPAAGGLVSLTVNADGGCSWTASSSAGWLRIGTGSGTGFGYVLATANPSSRTTPRTATITVNGQTARVTQAAAVTTSCTYSVSPTAPSLGAAPTSASLSVTAADGCAWSAASTTSWITITSASGTGSGFVSYQVSANSGSAARTGTITVAGRSITVTQAGTGGTTPPECDVELSVTAASAAASASTGAVAVTAASGCTWTAKSVVDWLTITGSAGAGSGWVSYAVAANPGPQRTGEITVGNRSLTVTQAAAPPPPPPATSTGPAAPRGVRIVNP